MCFCNRSVFCIRAHSVLNQCYILVSLTFRTFILVREEAIINKGLFISTFTENYNKELEYLTQFLNYCNHILDSAPEGRLQIHRRKSGLMYVLSKKDAADAAEACKTHHRYMSIRDPELRTYVEKYCAEKVLKYAEKGLRQLNCDPKGYDPSDIICLLERLDNDFGDLLPVAFRGNARIIGEWEMKEGVRQPFRDKDLIFQTARGDYVRTKIEMITADILYELNLHYIYEKRIRLKNGKWKRPDFTILSHVNGNIYYLEICGMLSNPDYCDNLAMKIQEYSETGIILGKNLLLMFESENAPFNANTLKRMLRSTVMSGT